MRTCRLRPDIETLNRRPIPVQNGWRPDGGRNMILTQPHWSEMVCAYADRANDPNCGDCERRQK